MTTPRAPLTLAVAGLALIGLAGVATLAGCNMKMQQTHGTRNSGQSRLMDDTFAGQNACNPDDHTRPFIIEWDATDMSSFESLAAGDIVFVKYEGCSLKVLDACKNDSVRGSEGAYKPPTWTSGSLETIDIHNEGELYAKLPLGSASLGGRVSGGEQFHMEYFVAGTVNATRDAVYRADLQGNPGCGDATHFVYGYNLGAFALGSANETAAEAGGSIYGFGAGGKTSSGRSAEKKGGDLTVCRADSATEVSGCKTPIRLNLREIYDGESPESQAMAAEETPESAAAAAIINAKMEMSEEARAHYDAAMAKANANDGKGCLKELDIHDGLNPKQKSSDPASPSAMFRAQCVMRAGKCNAGKEQLRKAAEKAGWSAQFGPEHVDRTVEAMASMYCQGANMSDRDKVIKARAEITKGAYQATMTVDFCMKQYAVLKKLGPKVKPKDDYDSMVKDTETVVWTGVPACLARAGDCKKARKVYEEALPERVRTAYKDMDPEARKKQLDSGFASSVQVCKDK